MRQAASVAFLIITVGVVWFMLALTINGQSEGWAGGLFIALIGGAGLLYIRYAAEYNYELKQHIETMDAVRRGLYK